MFTFSCAMSNSNFNLNHVSSQSNLPTQAAEPSFFVVAGPCSIESAELFLESAKVIKECGGNGLRGAVYKMRTDPDSFQGLGREGYKALTDAREIVKLPIFTEVVDIRHLDELEPLVDVFQVGARNMYNYELLKELGRRKKPVFLKRGFSATLDEWQGAAEYVLKGGNPNVILCERGVRGFDPHTRNILDLSSVVLMKKRTGLRVFVDPSHGTGRRDLVIPLALAAAAVGADGLIVEVHPNPAEALSDADQAITLVEFKELMARLKPLLIAVRDFKV